MNYLKSLQLQYEPFSNSPDPSFFYCSHSYQTCLQDLEIAIRLKRGLNIVLGDIGTGKTTLSRALLQQFRSESESFIFHLILDPSFNSEHEFLYALLKGFGIASPGEENSFAYKEAIRQFLLTEGIEKGRVIVLIVDEGQKINDVCLELLRDLLNFETNEFKLLQLIIFAQNEFNAKIQGKRNLADRINTFYTLTPLSKSETRNVIEFRLLKAGWNKGYSLFSPEAIETVYKYSGGYPRKIVTLCHHALLCMLIRNASQVEPEMVIHAASQIYEYNCDYKGEEPKRNRELDPAAALPFSKSRFLHLSWRGVCASTLPLFLVIILGLSIVWGTKSMNGAYFAFSGSKKKRPASVQIVYPEENPANPAPIKEFSYNSYGSGMPDSANASKSEQHEKIQGDEVNQQDADCAEIPGPARVIEKEGDMKQACSLPLKLTIKRDDYVLALAKRIYGRRITYPILEHIREANPHIQDINHVKQGDQVLFPEIPESVLNDPMAKSILLEE